MNADNRCMIICWMTTPMNEINKVAIDHLVLEGLILESNDGYKWSQEAIDHYDEYNKWLN